MIFGLLHSPFVTSASSWGTLPVALADLGHEVVVVDADAATMPKEYAWAAVAQLPDSPLVLVAHSGAGLLVPVIAARRDHTWIRGAIFLDASLPGPTGESRLAALRRRRPDEAAELARTLYAGGSWPAPDEAGWESVTPVPRDLAFHGEPIPVPAAGWGALPWAYLRTSEAYDEEAAAAEASGHLVVRRDGGHFAAAEASVAVAADLDAIGATFGKS